MESTSEINGRFKSHKDYNNLARVVFAACKARYPESFKPDFDDYQIVPYAWEIQHFLNHPNATLDHLYCQYEIRMMGSEVKFTREQYLTDPSEWEMIRGIVNALRHTVKPAVVHY